MSCFCTPEQGKICLVFDIEADCDIALSIQNSSCATCDNDCGVIGTVWAEKRQRPDGKWYFFKNPGKMTGIEGILSYTEENYSDLFEPNNGLGD